MRATLLAAALIAVASAFDCSFVTSYPRQYVAYQTDAGEPALVLDGRLDDPAWQAVTWTEDFVDISTATAPMFRTRAKIRWDSEYLYVGAELQDTAAWANITSTCHCLDPNPAHDQVIFHDNDFEIFVDPAGTTHMYKEFEMNAANGTWDLCLNKPYNDGGYENSTRVFGPAGFDMFWMTPGLKSAAWTDGALNDPSVPHARWSVEVALPLQGLAYNTSATVPPQPGSYWRINFSRVEWHTAVINGAYWKEPSCQSCPVPGAPVEDNWVWSPQGSIAMHLPEKWGFLQFATGPVNNTPPVRSPEWPARSVAAAIYYAQHSYAANHSGAFASSPAALAPFAVDPVSGAPAPWIVNGSCTAGLPAITVFTDASGAPRFNATAVDASGSFAASITDDRFLTVAPVPPARALAA